jgi:hypothetical protein
MNIALICATDEIDHHFLCHWFVNKFVMYQCDIKTSKLEFYGEN